MGTEDLKVTAMNMYKYKEGLRFCNSHPGQSFSLSLCEPISFSGANAHMAHGSWVQFPTLVRAFLYPCVGPFSLVGLMLAWLIWGRNVTLHITLKSVMSVQI